MHWASPVSCHASGWLEVRKLCLRWGTDWLAGFLLSLLDLWHQALVTRQSNSQHNQEWTSLGTALTFYLALPSTYLKGHMLKTLRGWFKTYLLVFLSLVVAYQCLRNTLQVTHFKEMPFNNKNATASKTLRRKSIILHQCQPCHRVLWKTINQKTLVRRCFTWSVS